MAPMLSGCAPGANGNGTPTTVSQPVAGTGYATYDAAVAAEMAYIEAGKPDPKVIAAIRPLRRNAYAALDALRRASAGGGNATAELAAFHIATQAFADYLASQHISAGGPKP